MLRRLTAAAVVTYCLLLPAAPAFASGADVIIDCNDHGHLSREYSQREYRQALAQMPADVKQYTDCENIIRRAQRGLPTIIANTANPMEGATPEERAEAESQIAQARTTGGATQRIGPHDVMPGALAYTEVSAATTDLPTPLLVLVTLILVAALSAAYPVVQARRRERPGELGS